MQLEYKSDKVMLQCTSMKEAKKLFGGNNILAISLLSRFNALESADTIKDIIVQNSFRFHKLTNKNRRNLEGYFAIDVKSKKEKWRIILQPLDEEKKPYDPCHIDEIAGIFKIIEIMEVSNHYE